VPGWHEATRELQQQGKLQMLGIIQEQHPYRARLFMQWKQMDWPILVDSYNLLGTSLVPITLLIDEYGIVRHSVSSAAGSSDTLEAFLATTYEPPARMGASTPGIPELDALERRAGDEASAVAWRNHADALALWGGKQGIDPAIASYRQAIELAPEEAPTEFRLGVTLRRRYDSAQGTPTDFGAAIEHWTRALSLDPNNYIWRRRIQQYGPRLDKPYPFYDWVDEARGAIEARGETPVVLPVEPRGAELAQPARVFDVAEAPPEPDPEGRILRDEGRYVRLDSALVPPVVPSGGTARVHLELRPVVAVDAHWNNEAAGLVVWLDPPSGWEVDRRRVEAALPPTAVSDEPRRIELELRRTENADVPAEITGYALYYVCEGRQGACLYRRQDFSFPLVVASQARGG